MSCSGHRIWLSSVPFLSPGLRGQVACGCGVFHDHPASMSQGVSHLRLHKGCLGTMGVFQKCFWTDPLYKNFPVAQWDASENPFHFNAQSIQQWSLDLGRHGMLFQVQITYPLPSYPGVYHMGCHLWNRVAVVRVSFVSESRFCKLYVCGWTALRQRLKSPSLVLSCGV